MDPKIIFNKIAFKVMLDIETGKNMSEIAKGLTTHSYMAETIRILEKGGLLKTKKVNRTRIITITEKGEKVKVLLSKIVEVLKDEGNQFNCN